MKIEIQVLKADLEPFQNVTYSSNLSSRDVSYEGLAATMATNAVGPLIIAKSVVPLLQKGNAAFSSQQRLLEKKDFRGVIVNMSAGVASITGNALGGWYSYRMSKVGK